LEAQYTAKPGDPINPASEASSLPPLDVHINIDDLPKQVLGETRGYINLKGLEDNKLAAIHMASQGQRSLNLFTPNLDPRVFDNEAFIDAEKRSPYTTRVPKCRSSYSTQPKWSPVVIAS